MGTNGIIESFECYFYDQNTKENLMEEKHFRRRQRLNRLFSSNINTKESTKQSIKNAQKKKQINVLQSLDSTDDKQTSLELTSKTSTDISLEKPSEHSSNVNSIFLNNEYFQNFQRLNYYLLKKESSRILLMLNTQLIILVPNVKSTCFHKNFFKNINWPNVIIRYLNFTTTQLKSQSNHSYRTWQTLSSYTYSTPTKNSEPVINKHDKNLEIKIDFNPYTSQTPVKGVKHKDLKDQNDVKLDDSTKTIKIIMNGPTSNKQIYHETNRSSKNPERKSSVCSSRLSRHEKFSKTVYDISGYHAVIQLQLSSLKCKEMGWINENATSPKLVNIYRCALHYFVTLMKVKNDREAIKTTRNVNNLKLYSRSRLNSAKSHLSRIKSAPSVSTKVNFLKIDNWVRNLSIFSFNFPDGSNILRYPNKLIAILHMKKIMIIYDIDGKILAQYLYKTNNFIVYDTKNDVDKSLLCFNNSRNIKFQCDKTGVWSVGRNGKNITFFKWSQFIVSCQFVTISLNKWLTLRIKSSVNIELIFNCDYENYCINITDPCEITYTLQKENEMDEFSYKCANYDKKGQSAPNKRLPNKDNNKQFLDINKPALFCNIKYTSRTARKIIQNMKSKNRDKSSIKYAKTNLQSQSLAHKNSILVTMNQKLRFLADKWLQFYRKKLKIIKTSLEKIQVKQTLPSVSFRREHDLNAYYLKRLKSLKRDTFICPENLRRAVYSTISLSKDFDKNKCFCSVKEITHLSDFELKYYIDSSKVTQQLLILIIIASGSVYDKTGYNTMLNLYGKMQKDRVHVCKESENDKYRLFLYDIDQDYFKRVYNCSVHPMTNIPSSILKDRHNIKPGMFMIYKNGVLLFCNYIFDGYGKTIRHFNNQVTKLADLSQTGFYIPNDFQFSSNERLTSNFNK
ncbi:hypothetical protein A3Q56_05003 [Intoshia linei]|uniref:Uncharacterized protein n=1 Tax=Intoshia linei TaxID=1819745 RepID=A0A177AZL3_9BILA|nr:hypothetical protein A3Q56_05003 [Intoshia linei]